MNLNREDLNNDIATLMTNVELHIKSAPAEYRDSQETLLGVFHTSQQNVTLTADEINVSTDFERRGELMTELVEVARKFRDHLRSKKDEIPDFLSTENRLTDAEFVSLIISNLDTLPQNELEGICTFENYDLDDIKAKYQELQELDAIMATKKAAAAKVKQAVDFKALLQGFLRVCGLSDTQIGFLTYRG